MRSVTLPMPFCASPMLTCTGVTDFGLSEAVEGHKDKWLHLNGRASVTCNSLEVRPAAIWDAMKMERTVVILVVNV